MAAAFTARSLQEHPAGYPRIVPSTRQLAAVSVMAGIALAALVLALGVSPLLAAVIFLASFALPAAVATFRRGAAYTERSEVAPTESEALDAASQAQAWRAPVRERGGR